MEQKVPVKSLHEPQAVQQDFVFSGIIADHDKGTFLLLASGNEPVKFRSQTHVFQRLDDIVQRLILVPF